MFGKKKMQAEAKAEQEKQYIAEMKKAARNYLVSVNQLTEGKQDWQIDWLDFGKFSYESFYRLSKEYPEIKEIAQWHPAGPERIYEWMDADCSWHNWPYSDMQEHLQIFIRDDTWGRYRRRFAEKHPGVPLKLEYIGYCGGGSAWPYQSVAYLSYAYWTQDWQNTVNQRLYDWLAK